MAVEFNVLTQCSEYKVQRFLVLVDHSKNCFAWAFHTTVWFGAVAGILDHTEISFTFAFLSTTAWFGIVESMVDHSHSISSYSVGYSLAPPR